jgi:CTP synthase
MKTKFIFVAGGVMSGVGKGTATASIAAILKGKKFKVSAVKIDPYINVDAGTMNPIEHGEIFVTKDGTECDQDIGHYERFLNEELTGENYLTTGRVYLSVIEKERSLKYGGRCVEVVPDIPNEVIFHLKKLAKKRNLDFLLVEIGGTVGEYQNLLFLEAARLMKLEDPKKIAFVLVSYLPVPETIGEMKTKPTQTAVRLLNEAGLQPDFILGRGKFPLDEPRRRKLSIFCNVLPENVISAPDVKNIYQIPLNFEKEKLGKKILKKFGMKDRKSNLKHFEKLLENIQNPKGKVKIGIVGKYFETGDFVLSDAYISLIEALKSASWFLRMDPQIEWLFAERYEKNKKLLEELKNFDGIVVPGGFGKRGIEGKINAIRFCRENKIPFLGLCLGLQLAVVEFARNVCNLKKANSTEFSKNCLPIIDLLPEQERLLKEKKYGKTMRLGNYRCKIQKGTLAYKAYKKMIVLERHRHRYEVNNKFLPILRKKGMIFSGINPERNLVEIIELKDHPFFLATQFHPEYKSTPFNPHPLFVEFIKACKK